MPGDPLGLMTAPLLGVAGTLLGSGATGGGSATGGLSRTPAPLVSASVTPPVSAPSRSSPSVATTSPDGPATAATGGTSNPIRSQGDPFASPFADWLDSVDSALGTPKVKVPHGGGGGSGGSSGGGSGASSGGSSGPSNSPGSGPTPFLASSGSASDALWQAMNSLGLGGSSSSATTATTSLVSQTTTGSGLVGQPVTPAQRAWLQQSANALGQVFEPNVGQAAKGVVYVAQGFGSSVALKPQEMDLTVQTASAGAQSHSATVSPTALSLQLVGANATAQAVAGTLLESRSNYFGGDSSQWRTNVPNYSSVTFTNVYQGIDVTYYANNAGRLEFDFTVAPGADPSQIRFRAQGADSVTLDSQGNLLLHTPAGDVTQSAPNNYQTMSAGRSNVAGSYVHNADGSIGFAAGAYDKTKPLVVDPSISYSTLLSDETTPNSIAVDGAGDAYVAGTTALPSANDEAFVTKLSPDGSQRIYTSYITVNGGSSGNVYGKSIAIDSGGNAYLGGWTDSSAFPTTSGAYKTLMQGSSDDFVAKFNATGMRCCTALCSTDRPERPITEMAWRWRWINMATPTRSALPQIRRPSPRRAALFRRLGVAVLNTFSLWS